MILMAGKPMAGKPAVDFVMQNPPFLSKQNFWRASKWKIYHSCFMVP